MEDEIPMPNDGESVSPEELEATSAALGAVADDLAETSALARIAGLDRPWTDQVRFAQAAQSVFAEEAARSRRLFADVAQTAAAHQVLKAQQERIQQIARDALAATNQGLVDEIRRSFTDPIDEVLASFRKVPVTLTHQVEKFIAAMRSHHPPNWPDLEDDTLPIGLLSTFVKETRWPIVWVPEPNVVRALAVAPAAERDEVLVGHQDTIISNCRDALAQCAGTVISDLVPFAQEAVAAAADGHLRAAQAQAAAVVTTVLEVHLEFPSLGQAATGLTIDTDEVPFDRARIGYILSCVPQSLTNFGDRANGAPIPGHFNRHATLHRVSEIQYTPRNAVVSLLLVTALLREIDELDRKGRWESLLE